MEEQLEWWCDRLEGHEPAFRELEAQGCWLEMDCFVASHQSAIIEVSADLQKRLSQLRLNLSVFFSPDARSSNGDTEQANAADRE
ncbi:MAG: hypothetical protein ACR2H6_15365 [Pyrinomonadaceae bacterium]